MDKDSDSSVRDTILDEYLIDRRYKIALIYEGQTEDRIIKLIFNVLNVDEMRDGVFLYCARGQGNIKRLEGMIELARKDNVEPFLILDRDADWQRILQKYERSGSNKTWYIKKSMYKVWKKDLNLIILE